MKVNIYNAKAEVTGEKELAPGVFDVAINESLVHQAAVAQMANERQVLAHTKDRSEVRGGGKKPWKQKGTGRARAGSSRSPLWIGGGVTFGPTKDRNFSKKINARMKRKALTMVLTDKARNDALVVLENLQLSQAKTKQADALLQTLEKNILAGNKAKRSIIVIAGVKDDDVRTAMRNLADVSCINLQNINIVDLLKYRTVVTSKECIEQLESRYAKTN